MATLMVTLAGCGSRVRAPVEDRAAVPPPRPPATSALPVPPAAVPPAAPSQSEADWRPPNHTVKRGDTLHQIALDYGLDYRELAVWNQLENPNLILVGQVLRLTAPGEPTSAPTPAGVTVAPLRSAPAVVEAKPGAASSSAPGAPASMVAGSRHSETYKTTPKALKERYSEQAMRDIARAVTTPPVAETVAAAPAPVAPTLARADPKAESAPAFVAEGEGDDKINWVWPSKGRVVGNFSETANLKGIDIAGTAGQPVVASASGTVVYAGSGLRGYGKLIIIKHNKTYLSAYAHNRDILVKEGQVVARGEKIAEMGSTDASDVKLHFEIRRLGKPMDPARYLPPA